MYFVFFPPYGLDEVLSRPNASLVLSTHSPVLSHSPIGPVWNLPNYHYIYPKFFARSLFVALMVEAVSSSELSVNICYNRWRYIPENSHLQVGSMQSIPHLLTVIHKMWD
jgi:hypothetical protein